MQKHSVNLKAQKKKKQLSMKKWWRKLISIFSKLRSNRQKYFNNERKAAKNKHLGFVPLVILPGGGYNDHILMNSEDMKANENEVSIKLATPKTKKTKKTKRAKATRPITVTIPPNGIPESIIMTTDDEKSVMVSSDSAVVLILLHVLYSHTGTDKNSEIWILLLCFRAIKAPHQNPLPQRQSSM